MESRGAVLREIRVEYFRGKDFVSFLKNHEDLKDILESDRNIEVEDIANILLARNLLVRCDRVVKTVRPGKNKMSTWPAHLEIFHVSLFFLSVQCGEYFVIKVSVYHLLTECPAVYHTLCFVFLVN